MTFKFRDDLFVDQSQLVRTYGKGRACQHEGCNTVLSAYNPATYCALHEGEHEQIVDIAMYYKPCARCGAFKDGRSYREDASTVDGLADVCIRCTDNVLRKADERAALVARLRRGREKTCQTCGARLPADLQHFAYSRRSRDLLRSMCRVCDTKGPEPWEVYLMETKER